ncbi:hypothetical protein B0H19DRAFT_1129603 [Mycena capillaripes]|nr:hypothetical protein B0H19DRAFT_1129603 [Mycena capillaripes]
MTPARIPTRLRPLFETILPRVNSYRTTQRVPLSLLPTELWEAIFHELPRNRDLLRISTVCRIFNLLCIRIFLARNNSSEAIFSLPVMDVRSHLLDAFHLSVRTFPLLERVVCEFEGLESRQGLECIRGIIARSKNLRSVVLCSRTDLFHVSTDTAARRALMNAFCAVLSETAQRIDGPVFIFSISEIFSCSPRDIAGWNLDLFQFNHALEPRGIINRARRAFNIIEEPRKPWDDVRTKIRLHTGKRHRVHALTTLRSATIESITHDSGRLRSFTVLVFNGSLIRHLSLAPAYDKIPAEDLSAVIVHVSLPYLRSVDIGIGTLCLSALRLFILRHPTIEKIRFRVYSTQSTTRPMIDPPLAHPGLKEIHVSAGDVVTGLEDSPNLQTFSFAFSSSLLSAEHAGLINTIRQISVRTSDTTLQLFILDNRFNKPDATLWCSGDEIAAVARALHCIRSLKLTCFSMEDGFTVLPWLALLPAISNIDFHLFLTRGSPPVEEADLPDELAKFLASAHATLPHVPDITGSAY